VDARDSDLGIDCGHFVERRWPNQVILFGLNVKNGNGDSFELRSGVNGENLAESRCKNFRFDGTDCRTNSLVK